MHSGSADSGRAEAVDKPEREIGPVGDDEKRGDEDGDIGDGGTIKLNDRFLKSEARDEQIHADGRREIADLEVGEEDDAQVDWVHPEVAGDGDDERDDDDDPVDPQVHAEPAPDRERPPEDAQQALDRSGDAESNKGSESALAALQMIGVMRGLRP